MPDEIEPASASGKNMCPERPASLGDPQLLQTTVEQITTHPRNTTGPHLELT